MVWSRAVVFAALTATAGAAQAWGLGARIGTTGVGADFGFDIAPTLGGRIGVSGGSFSTDFSTDDVSYDAKVKMANLALLLDWSPLGPFRITGGIVPNNNKIDLNGQVSNNGGSVTGSVEPAKSAAPYLGIGYGNVWTKGVNFYFDLGVMFQGSPQVALSATCNPGLGAAQCAAIQSNVEAERQRVQNELEKYKYYPVANIGITIGF
jgi:hypothetical protein